MVRSWLLHNTVCTHCGYNDTWDAATWYKTRDSVRKFFQIKIPPCSHLDWPIKLKHFNFILKVVTQTKRPYELLLPPTVTKKIITRALCVICYNLQGQEEVLFEGSPMRQCLHMCQIFILKTLELYEKWQIGNIAHKNILKF